MVAQAKAVVTRAGFCRNCILLLPRGVLYCPRCNSLGVVVIRCRMDLSDYSDYQRAIEQPKTRRNESR